MTPSSCIFANCLATSCRTANGTHLTGCFFGTASPVLMCISVQFVSPLSPSVTLKASLYFSRRVTSCVLSCSGMSRSLSWSRAMSCFIWYFVDSLSVASSETELTYVYSSVSSSGSTISTSAAFPISVPSGILSVIEWELEINT